MSKDKDTEKNSDDVNTQPVKKQSAEPANADEAITQPVVKPKEDLASGEDVLDPLTLRDSDTSKLKRVKPKSATQTVNLDSENVSDTVHLKVIKEKKKQLAGILTASQTIRRSGFITDFKDQSIQARRFRHSKYASGRCRRSSWWDTKN